MARRSGVGNKGQMPLHETANSRRMVLRFWGNADDRGCSGDDQKGFYLMAQKAKSWLSLAKSLDGGPPVPPPLPLQKPYEWHDDSQPTIPDTGPVSLDRLAAAVHESRRRVKEAEAALELAKTNLAEDVAEWQKRCKELEL
jgi:hypothetical protein